MTDQLGWTHTIEFRLWLHSSEFFWLAVVVYLLGAVPLAVRLHAYLGLDRISRTWTRLQPLRLSMTAVVPESRFDLGYDDRRIQKTTLQLHQTIIEIRDAILQLRPYVRDIAPHEWPRLLKPLSVPTHERGAAAQALQLAHAARTKAAGATPEPRNMTQIVRSRSATLDEEAAELLALAKWWTPACVATERLTPMSPEAKASWPA